MPQITLFSSVKDNIGQPVETSQEELLAALAEHDERTDKQGPLWSPASFRGIRAIANVRSVAALVLDFDHQADLSVLEELLDGSWAGLAHSTFSDDPAGQRAFRVVLPYARPISAKEHTRIYGTFLAHFGSADDKCRDPSRAYFTPTFQPGREPFVRRAEGPWLDPDAFLGGADGTEPD